MTLLKPTAAQVAALVDGDRPVCAFLHDLDALCRQARSMIGALPPGAELFYAVKANNAAETLRALAPHVAGFEVASAGEILKVRAAAGPDVRIIMGGPVRTHADIALLLAQRVERLHVESVQMLRIANAVAAEAGTTLPILLRVNLAGPVPGATLTMGGVATQFGIAQSDIPDALRMLKECTALRFDGFHFHTVSNNRDAAGHAALCTMELNLARAWATEHGLDLRIVNLGGGWGVDYADPNWRFDVAGFARALASASAGAPALQFECGRILAAYHAVYVCEILDIKTVHGRAFALLRGGSHHFRLPSSWVHDHPFLVLPRDAWPHPWPRPELANTMLTLTGELCTPKDVLARNVPVARARIGDLICFLMAGAYGWEISHHDFLSHPHPERIYLGEAAA
ncbi:decarboxylase [Sphingomonas pokkalii]|uniref:Decarboxylase n=1 Tax=Sphingomonas pokkalii TaxID=2175090 RepID=A0A2U0SD48_9SPHN|nr:decarboxylase [Sphingomonas pokkalii]